MCQKKTFYVDVNAFLPQNLMILKADISKTSPGRHLFLFIFMCGNSKCTRIQKVKKISGEVNLVHQALRKVRKCTSYVAKTKALISFTVSEADLRLSFSHMEQVGFLMTRLICLNVMLLVSMSVRISQ